MDLHPFAYEFEIDPVGVDQVWERRFIAFALLLRIAFQRDDIFVDVFRLYPANRDILPLKDEIGHPGIAAFGFVDDCQIVGDAFEQAFQRCAVAVFGRLPCLELGYDLIEITGNIHKLCIPLVAPRSSAEESRRK